VIGVDTFFKFKLAGVSVPHPILFACVVGRGARRLPICASVSPDQISTSDLSVQKSGRKMG